MEVGYGKLNNVITVQALPQDRHIDQSTFLPLPFPLPLPLFVVTKQTHTGLRASMDFLGPRFISLACFKLYVREVQKVQKGTRTRLNKGVTELSNDRASRVYATHREIVERITERDAEIIRVNHDCIRANTTR